MPQKTFKMNYVVYSDKLEKVAAEGDRLIVYYDYRRGRSCEIPAGLLSVINTSQPNP